MSLSTPPPPPEGGGGASSRSPDPIAALLLNLFLGGIGYLYIAQKSKAIVAIVIWLSIALPTCFAGAFLIGIVFAADAYLQARQLGEGHAIGEWTVFHQCVS